MKYIIYETIFLKKNTFLIFARGQAEIENNKIITATRKCLIQTAKYKPLQSQLLTNDGVFIRSHMVQYGSEPSDKLGHSHSNLYYYNK